MASIRTAGLTKNFGDLRAVNERVVVMFLMAFADMVHFVHPGTLEQIMAGEVGFELTQGLLLFSVLLTIPISVIFFTRVLQPRANRWANIIAAASTMVFVIGVGSTTLSYIFSPV